MGTPLFADIQEFRDAPTAFQMPDKLPCHAGFRVWEVLVIHPQVKVEAIQFVLAEIVGRVLAQIGPFVRFSCLRACDSLVHTLWFLVP